MRAVRAPVAVAPGGDAARERAEPKDVLWVVAGIVGLGSWLVSGELGAETLGEVILWAAVVALAAFAIAEAAIARGESA